MKVDFSKLDRAFNPKCVAVIGDKGPGYRWLRQNMHVMPHLYSVQIDPKEIDGIKALGVTNYSSIMEIPEPVDYVVVAVPREVTPRIVPGLIQKDVATAFFFTAGFSETHTEKGIQLEKALKDMAEPANLHLIGPNCMGIMNPRASGIMPPGQSAPPPPPREPSALQAGAVGLMAQSGMHAQTMGREAVQQGLKVGKLVSYGNGTMLDSTDYLEYYGQDPTITTIGMYVEGTRDGRRFLKVLKNVCARKPVVIWKGGRTDAGVRTIAFHTNSLSSPKLVWDAAVKQCGAISVNNVEQLVDVLQALQFLPPINGDGVGITGGTGGQGVAMTDAFSEAGMRVPRLTQESLDKFATVLTMIGGSYNNPVDTGNENRSSMPKILEVLEQDANLDNLVVLTGARAGGGAGQFDTFVDALSEIRKRGKKPVMTLMPLTNSPGEAEQAQTTMGKLQEAGIPAFFSIERGAFALRKAYEYYSMKRNMAAG